MSFVCITGDVAAIPSAATTYPPIPGSVGTWIAGKVIETKTSILRIDGRQCLFTVQCTFTFTGTVPPDPTVVTGESTVILNGTTLLFKESGLSLVKNFDEESDAYGNKLVATASKEKLATT